MKKKNHLNEEVESKNVCNIIQLSKQSYLFFYIISIFRLLLFKSSVFIFLNYLNDEESIRITSKLINIVIVCLLLSMADKISF